jgi:hypothetical protein
MRIFVFSLFTVVLLTLFFLRQVENSFLYCFLSLNLFRARVVTHLVMRAPACPDIGVKWFKILFSQISCARVTLTETGAGVYLTATDGSVARAIELYIHVFEDRQCQ